jgi:hypothetical protein
MSVFRADVVFAAMIAAPAFIVGLLFGVPAVSTRLR